MQAKVNINGKILDPKNAKISIFDRGFMYGDSVYEVLRTYDGVPLFLEEHFDRLENSARLAQMKISQSRIFLKKEIRRTIKATKAKRGTNDVFIRFTVTRGEGPMDLDPGTAKKTNYIIIVKEVSAWNPRFYKLGMKLAIPQIRRNHPRALDPNIKSGNYLNNVLAVGEAKKIGADDALLCNLQGHLSEASNSNIFFVMNDIVYTPSQEVGNLRGITREAIKKICEKNHIGYLEEQLDPKNIGTASECFVSSATREVMPVEELRLESSEKMQFPAGGGKITKEIQTLYKQFLHEYAVKNKKQALF